MSWHGIEGHDRIVEQFRAGLRRGRLASTFLFVGPRGVGKRAFAMKFAQALLCLRRPAELLDPCETCDACHQLLAGTHPDLLWVAKPAGKSEIPLELLIGEGEERMRAGLCHDIALKPFMGGRRVAIIDDADDLNREGSNCLLKTLEEPPPRSVLILIGVSADAQLPTIRSRSQLVPFRPLSDELVATIVERQGAVANRQDAERLAAHSGGSVSQALELADPEIWKFRTRLLAGLAQSPLESRRLSAETNAFIEDAGKEASERRLRAKQVLTFAVEFWRQALRAMERGAVSPDSDVGSAAARRLERTHLFEAVAAALERTMDAVEHVERNANQTTLIESWWDDLARIVDRDGWRSLPAA